ncbi:hypothetical protein DRZ77_00750 [Candidatus Woesearchaeota archaeon]|nr:haloacid dehalogenase-like hydrolase [Candidatus Woesearchaeota archaeon]RLE40942.1 MAG: hypothetical protein DRZ77_00750 [Candidatus Woesearchaeota archaeon]
MTLKYVFFDFDRTLTPQDTTTLLIRLIHESYPPEEKTVFEQLWSIANTNYSTQIGEAMLRFFERERTKQHSREETLSLLSDTLKEVELSSARSIAPYLKYVTKSKLRKAGAKIFIPHREILKQLASKYFLFIISLNWSRDIILGALKDIVQPERILCNDLHFNSDGVAIGGLELKIASPEDKLKEIKKIVENEEYLFVGDGIHDIWCLVNAKYGCIINPQEILFSVLYHLGYNDDDIKIGLHKQPGLYMVHSIEEVAKFLYDLIS